MDGVSGWMGEVKEGGKAKDKIDCVEESTFRFRFTGNLKEHKGVRFCMLFGS